MLGLLAAGAALAQQGEARKPDAPVYSVVEPKAPAKAKPAVRKRAARANAKIKSAAAARPAAMARADVLKANGPCVVKPVMSDQDLVNCGATPPRY
jgi:hypothetical protein